MAGTCRHCGRFPVGSAPSRVGLARGRRGSNVPGIPAVRCYPIYPLARNLPPSATFPSPVGPRLPGSGPWPAAAGLSDPPDPAGGRRHLTHGTWRPSRHCRNGSTPPLHTWAPVCATRRSPSSSWRAAPGGTDNDRRHCLTGRRLSELVSCRPARAAGSLTQTDRRPAALRDTMPPPHVGNRLAVPVFHRRGRRRP